MSDIDNDNTKYVHGNNINRKIANKSKNTDKQNNYLDEISRKLKSGKIIMSNLKAHIYQVLVKKLNK